MPDVVTFASPEPGVRLEGDWYGATSAALTTAAGTPVLVMAHGYGCTRDCGLAPFAERFAAVGLHVLAIDYRGFGTSGGGPRQLVSHLRQRADYHAAVAFARSRRGVDPDRVVLWGTSYSGGHVVAVAAQDVRVAAVVSQGAAVDGLAILTKKEKADPDAPADKGRRMVAAAMRDAARAALTPLTGAAPVLVDSVGPPGAFAMLTDAASWQHYEKMMGPTWNRRVCARSLLRLPANRPVTLAHRVGCPTLFVITEGDTITPPAAVRATAARMPDAEVVAFEGPHFEIYRDPVRPVAGRPGGVPGARADVAGQAQRGPSTAVPPWLSGLAAGVRRCACPATTSLRCPTPRSGRRSGRARGRR